MEQVENRPFDHSRYGKKHVFPDKGNFIGRDLGVYGDFPKPEKIPTHFINKKISYMPKGKNLIFRFEILREEIFGYEWHD